MLHDDLPHFRESEELRRQLVQTSSELQAVQQEASEAQAAAKERHKRFMLLNATFRKKEEVLVSRAEDAEVALREALADADEAKQQAVLDKQVCTVLAFAGKLMADDKAACAQFTEALACAALKEMGARVIWNDQQCCPDKRLGDACRRLSVSGSWSRICTLS